MKKIKEFFYSNKNIVIISNLLLLFFFEFYFITFSKTLIIQLLIYTSVYFILLGILKNTKWATLIQSIILFIILTISVIKIRYLGEPFNLLDILFYKSTGEIFGLIDNTLTKIILTSIPKLLFVLIVYILINYINFKNNIRVTNIKRRIIIYASGLLVFLILFIPNELTYNFITTYIYDANKRKDYDAILNNGTYYLTYGHLAGIYGTYLENKVYKSKDYNEKIIEKRLKEIEKENDNTLGKPNIIVILSESFWDIDKLDEIEFNKEITKNISELKEEGLYFEMISPSYGGATANVEFEFLTGASLNYFGQSYIPYINLYRNKNNDTSPNIVKELKNNDYYTKIVPYTSSTLYNCGYVYEHFGFDEKEFNPEVDKKYIKGKYVSDEYITDKIIKEMNDKEKDKKLFYMTLTMQNHMPYTKDKYKKYDIKITKSNLSKENNEELLSYAQGVYDTDKELKRLYDYIKTYDEPTMIVFYGDHLPYLESSENLEYFNTKDNVLNTYRKYNTQSLVLANFDMNNLIEENKSNLQYMGIDTLSSYILNHMDIEISDYYKWLYSTRNTIGASNRFVSIDQKGKVYYTDNLTGKMQETNKLRKNIQYNQFIDKIKK